MTPSPQRIRRARARSGSRLGALVVQVLVLAVFAGAVAAYTGLSKTVVLTVDGVTTKVSTFASTVGGVLGRRGLSIGTHDLVAPSPAMAVSDGSHIVFEHGRALVLSVDGVRRTVWVTASTVAEALDELGLADRGAYVSASRSRAVPLSGLALTVRRAHGVTILHDGTSTHVRTNVATVVRALAAAHIRLGHLDRVSAPLRSMPRDGQRIRVVRVRKPHITVTSAIAYDTIVRSDSGLYEGQTRVARAGRTGVRVERFVLTVVNGTERHRRLLSSRVTREPRARIEYHGTKPRGSYGSHVEGADDLNWYALAGCESGHDSDNYTSPGYYGLYQFTLGTWHSLGGEGDPRDATATEQTYRAKLLYVRSGASPWPACGKYLYS